MRILREDITSDQAFAGISKCLMEVTRYNYEGENGFVWSLASHNFGVSLQGIMKINDNSRDTLEVLILQNLKSLERVDGDDDYVSGEHYVTIMECILFATTDLLEDKMVEWVEAAITRARTLLGIQESTENSNLTNSN